VGGDPVSRGLEATAAGRDVPEDRPDERSVGLIDREARRTIAEATDRSLLVEAGAGSGKTTALVARLLRLLERGVPLEETVAITFTERAAGELRSRIRGELSGSAAPWAAPALARIDRALIGTIHAVAERLLVDGGGELGLPPLLEVVDEFDASADFALAWPDIVEHLLRQEDLVDALDTLAVAGVTSRDLAMVAAACEEHWDAAGPETAFLAGTEDLEQALGDLVALAEDTRDIDQGDRLRHEIALQGELAAELLGIEGSAARLEALLAAVPLDRPLCPAPHRLGRRDAWGAARLSAARETLATAVARVEQWRVDTLASASASVVSALVAEAAARAERRARVGRLHFHDLLVWAERLLLRRREGGHPRPYHVLLDEVQDTDPIQMRLAVLLAHPDGLLPAERTAGVHPASGSLVVVGDPQQSIYRFRGADIGTLLRTRDRFGTDQLALTSNFRSVSGLVRALNGIFGRLIVEEPGTQPAFRPLVPTRPDPPAGPPAAVVGRGAALDLKAVDLRQAEAVLLAETVDTVLADEWAVEAEGDWRPARPEDIAVLLPTRAGLTPLVEELRDRGLSTVTPGSGAIGSSGVLDELRILARAALRPADETAVVRALLTAALGCGDDDLYAWRVEAGRSFVAGDGDDEREPVGQALASLARWSRLAATEPPGRALAAIADEARLAELSMAWTGTPEAALGIGELLERADEFGLSTGGGLEEFLRWLDVNAERVGRLGPAAEAVRRPAGAIEILTIHAAKGLEFPIVLLGGLATWPGSRSLPPLLRDRAGRIEARIRKGIETPGYRELAETERAADAAEARRLLYVACSRARDHLVVSLLRPLSGRGAAAAWLFEATGDLGLPDVLPLPCRMRSPTTTGDLPGARGD